MNIKVNPAISKAMKLMIISVALLLVIPSSTILFGQDLGGIVASLNPREINGDGFTGELTILIKNNSKETVFFELEPFDCYYDSDSIIFYSINSSRGLCINGLSFFKKDSKVVLVSGFLLITFLKFPPILSLDPGNSTIIKIQIDKENLQALKNLKWDVYFDVDYALKSEIDDALAGKPEKIIKEFNNSVYFRDTINIHLKFNRFSESDTSLYKSKSEKDYAYNVESIYDSILKNFWYRPKQK